MDKTVRRTWTTGSDLEQMTTVSGTTEFAKYEVQPQDDLSTIAYNNNLSVDQLVQANPDIEDLNAIQPGQEINIPTNLAPTGGIDDPTPTYQGGVGAGDDAVDQAAIKTAQDNLDADGPLQGQDYDGDGKIDAVSGSTSGAGSISAAELKDAGMNLDTIQELGPDSMEVLNGLDLDPETLESVKQWIEIEKSLDVEKFMGQEISAENILQTNYGDVAQQSLNDAGARVTDTVMKGSSSLESTIEVRLPGMENPLEGLATYQIENNGAVTMVKSTLLPINRLGRQFDPRTSRCNIWTKRFTVWTIRH